MVTMNILRMLVDVSFFYAFAGFVAAQFGGSGAFAGAIIQCLCFGISSAAGNKRLLRLILLLPMGLCWYIHRSSIADCIIMVPVGAYILWLTLKGDYALEQERQQRLFSLFWKVLLFFAAFAMLAGGAPEVTGVTLPFAMAMLIGSVLLMRSLRHDARVYCQKKYQLVNISAVALVVAAAYLMSLEPVLKGCAAVLKAGYSNVIVPVLSLLLRLLMLVIYGISKLLSFINLTPPQGDELGEVGGEGLTDFLIEEGGANEPNQLLQGLVIALLLAAAIVLLVLFFRWLNKKSAGTPAGGPAKDVRTSLPERQSRPGTRDSGSVRSVRAQYRKFLKLCADLGAPPKKGSTSLDVDLRARYLPGPGKVSGRVREIYILARYAGKADKDSVQRMKQLCAEAKSKSE